MQADLPALIQIAQDQAIIKGNDAVRFLQDRLKDILITDLVGQLMGDLELLADDLVGIIQGARHVEQ